MSFNSFEYATVFMEELDSQLLDQSTTGWMEENAGQVQYNGGAEVKIPKMQMSGLGNYDRDGGFAKGAVTVTYETRRLTQDRGRTFQLDAMDVNEMNFAPTAGAVMREFLKLMLTATAKLRSWRRRQARREHIPWMWRRFLKTCCRT